MSRWTYDSVLHVPEANDNESIMVGREVPRVKVLEQFGRASMRIFQAAYCMLAYRDGDEKHFIALGFDRGEEQRIDRLPEGIGLLGKLWEEGAQTIRLDDIACHRQSSGFPYGHPALEAFLGTPIRYDHQTLGVIYLSKAPGEPPFAVEDEATLEVLASACAIELTNSQTFEQLRQAYITLEARTDELKQLNLKLQAHEQELEERSQALSRANQQLKVHAIDLELLNEDLVAANRAKDQFLANTSHELRTPLNAIIGFSDLLADKRLGELNEKQRRYVGHISLSGKRLLGIINALLDISKIESGMMEIHETDFDPLELGEVLLSELRPLAEEKHIALHLQHTLPSQTNVHSDRDKLHQILMNLLGNAIKFTPEGGEVRLSLSLQQAEQGESLLHCKVEDNGIGIAEQDQARVFAPFVQASEGMNRSHGGTGLGLSLVKHMSELLGGTVELDSTPGQGSVFSVSLPVMTSHPEALASYPSVCHASVEKLPEYDDAKQPVVWIVDEYQARASTVQEMFNGEGYRVMITALDGVAEMAQKGAPLLIILGIPQEENAIYERLRHLKKLEVTNKTPTILLAGDADEPCFTTGATFGHIKQGLDRQDLLDMVSYVGSHMPKPPSAPSVLVVDDDESVREYLKEALMTEGYRVLLANNGEEGCQMAIEQDPDLIILDLMMPGTSGFEVVRRLKLHPSACDIPVVVFTAKELSRSEALLLGQDVERILVKGVSSRRDVLQQLRKLELLYPVRAKLMDTHLDCFNFRYMQRRLEQEIARANRYCHPFTLLSWEMDGYERYCQQHGKRWGMAALKASVSILHSIIRKGDVLVRWDQHRLMLLLPGLAIQDSHFVAEKIRLRISRQRLPLPKEQYGRMTVSIGGVSSDECEDAHSLIALLRQRVRQASEEGGNRMVLEGI